MNLILEERQRAARRRRAPVAEDATSGFCANDVSPDAAQTHHVEQLGAEFIRQALTIRLTEERLLDLFAEGQLSGTVHTCIGQEWTGVAISRSLQRGDAVVSNHRGHGHYLARTDDVEGLIAELMGRATGVCGGRGGSQHLCKDTFYSNGIQGGIVPLAAGLAMARKRDRRGEIAVVFIGDGTLGEGVVYETLNMAAKWALPLLIVVEDNGIAQSTPRTDAMAGTISDRARAFGIPVATADTWNVSGLLAVAESVVRQVRQTGTPTLLHVRTYRLRAHSKGDDERDPSAVARFAERDVLNQILAGTHSTVTDMVADIHRRLDRAVAQAMEAPPTSLATGRDVEDRGLKDCTWTPLTFEPKRVVDAIRDAFAEAMVEDARVILLGEDLCDPYGGAFKVTAGLSRRFGDRVVSTPISEAGIAGIGNGLAVAGWRPVVEIMFGDFLLLAADQFVNHAAKFAWMYNDQVRVPVIVRAPSGGYRGYGPTHSQCLEKHLLGVPGTRVLALHKRYCPGQLYRMLLAHNDRPTLVIENKLLYGQRTNAEPPPGWDLMVSNESFPTVSLLSNRPAQLTVVAYGGMVDLAESALQVLRQEEELDADLIIPMQLYPLDQTPIVESVSRTGRLLVVEEGQGFAGFGSEVIAGVVAQAGPKGFAARRVCPAASPIPAGKPAELQVLPDARCIVRTAVELILEGF